MKNPVIVKKATLLTFAASLACAAFTCPIGGCSRQADKKATDQSIVFSDAVIVVSKSNARHAKAAYMLSDEIEKRTGIRLPVADAVPQDGSPAIVLGTVESLGGTCELPATLTVPSKPEGYAIWTDVADNKRPAVYLVGCDDRGALFAAGRLIRVMRMAEQQISVPRDLRLADAPTYRLRGHMLIPGGNSIEWNAAGFEQLIRDMAIFGTNSFELTHFHDEVPEVLDAYGLDLWLFFGHGDVVDMKTLADVKERFDPLTGLDHVFIPFGDTGGVKPTRVMIPAIEKFAPLLKQVQPQAKIWISYQNQAYHAENDNEYLFGYIQNQRPEWLEGMVYGPWSHWDIPELRRRTPEHYKIRHYPDISHNLWCQYPIPKWDRAFARVWGRNGIRAMPKMMARVHNVTAPLSRGFVAYNHTGCKNDLDKFVFSAMAWDPNTDVNQVLYEYGKVFFGDDLAENVARGLLMLEDNWTGPIEENGSIERTLAHWQSIASHADVSKNWRLGLYLYRALIDAWVKRKYDAEMRFEAEAYRALKRAETDGAEAAVAAARRALAKVDTEFPAKHELREKIESLGLDKYEDRDLRDVVDRLYYALNDRQWLEAQFEEILTLQDTSAQLARIATIINWQDPGPGGFYDNLGVEAGQQHLVRQKSWRGDPGFVHSPIEFNVNRPDSDYRQSWLVTALTRYNTPLVMQYDNLDTNAKYRVRVVYSGPFDPVIRLVADGMYQIHGPIEQPNPMMPLEFDVPRQATSDGMLRLEWRLMNVRRGPGVAEVWLMKKQN